MVALIYSFGLMFVTLRDVSVLGEGIEAEMVSTLIPPSESSIFVIVCVAVRAYFCCWS